MRADDPARPKTGWEDSGPNRSPQMVLPDGTTCGALHEPQISPPRGWEFRVMICVGPVTGRWFSKDDLTETEVQALCLRWEEDPERVAREELGWKWKGQEATVRLEPETGTMVVDKSAEDLGL